MTRTLNTSSESTSKIAQVLCLQLQNVVLLRLCLLDMFFGDSIWRRWSATFPKVERDAREHL